MLKLALIPNEYITINGDIIVQLSRVAGGRAYLTVEADRGIPIVRGTLLERQGEARPACLTPPPEKKARHHRDRVYRWNDDRERAVRAMKQAIDLLEQAGNESEVKTLRTQLDRLIPTYWETEVPTAENRG